MIVVLWYNHTLKQAQKEMEKTENRQPVFVIAFKTVFCPHWVYICVTKD